MKKYLLGLLLLGLLVSACEPNAAPASLAGTWKLTAYGPAGSPTPAVTDAEATLTFGANGELSGNGGCNPLGGSYEVGGDHISFGPINSTLMACPDPQMAQEGVVHQVLTDTVSFKIEGNALTLTNKNMVLVFVRVDG